MGQRNSRMVPYSAIQDRIDAHAWEARAVPKFRAQRSVAEARVRTPEQIREAQRQHNLPRLYNYVWRNGLPQYVGDERTNRVMAAYKNTLSARRPVHTPPAPKGTDQFAVRHHDTHTTYIPRTSHIVGQSLDLGRIPNATNVTQAYAVARRYAKAVNTLR